MASPVDTSVKHALSTMVGASVINGVAGSRISALKAFLVTGFGVKTVDGAAAISAGKCRLPFSSGASAAVLNAVITVAGATPAALNGEQKVTAVANGWVEFATVLPDGPVSGSISFKIAPLGWEEVFFKTNVSVFRPTDTASSRPYLRVDDSNANVVTLQMYESMTDVDTGLGQSALRYIVARSVASATPVSWVLAGDSRGFHIGIAPYSASAIPDSMPNMLYYFGDCVSDRSGDAYPAVMMGNSTTTVTAGDGALLIGAATALIMRIAAGMGGASFAAVTNEMLSSAVSGASTSFGDFPSRAAQAMFLLKNIVSDGGTFATNGRRGVIPGVLYVPQNGLLATYERTGRQVVGSGDYSNTTLLSVLVGLPSVAATGVGFIDITGPWRPKP